MERVLLAVLLVGVTAIWGWTFVVVKDATAAYGVVGFLAIRFAIAAAALGPICLKRVTWRTLRAGAGIGVAMAAGYLLQTFGLQYTTPTNSGLITGLFVVFAPIIILTMEPVFAVLFGYWLAGDRLTAIQVAGAACVLAAQVWATAWGLRRRDEA